MNTDLRESFLQLVKLGIGTLKKAKIPKEIDWKALKALAEEQGLSAVILDALNTDSSTCLGQVGTNFTEGMPQELKLEWIGEMLQDYEGRNAQYKKAIGSLAGVYNEHGFKMMVLKGYACSFDWPKPEHRPCGDIDIWQFGKQREADSTLSKEKGIEIDNSQHHHTVFEWEGFTVENHYDFINVKHHPSHRGLESIFKELGKDNSHYVDLSGERVYIPSPNLHALFLLRHSLNHFASIGINLRNVLDWAFFVEKHTKEIDWNWLEGLIDEYHMRDFYNCFNAICVEDLGFSSYIFPLVQYLPSLKDEVLNEILNPAIPNEKPKNVFQRIVWKVKRWKVNKWKHELCYNESMWSTFWYGVWGHLLKPSSI